MAGDRAILLDWRLYPDIDSCTEEMIDGTTHRRLVAADGAQFLEKSMEGDLSMAYGYAIIESPLPVKDYESTLEVREMGEDSVIVWSSTFAGDGASESAAEEILGGISQAGLDALKAKFAE